MGRLLKRVAKLCGVVLIVLLAATLFLSWRGTGRFSQHHNIQPQLITINNDRATLERGLYLTTASCTGCHSADLGGQAFLDDPAIGVIPAPNLTRGEGGVGSRYNQRDYVRAIRHGVDADGLPLVVMPSDAYWYFSDADVGAIVAYIETVPAVDRELPEPQIAFMGRLLAGAGVLNLFAVERIEHDGIRPSVPTPAVAAEYGQYLVNVGDCRQCHGLNLAGGQPSDPASPPGPDLTPAGSLASLSNAEFTHLMRTGMMPDGRMLDSEYMPWTSYRYLSDDDLSAIFLYLQTLPAPAKQ